MTEILETFERQLATTRAGKQLLAELTAEQIAAIRNVVRQTAANVAQASMLEDES